MLNLVFLAIEMDSRNNFQWSLKMLWNMEFFETNIIFSKSVGKHCANVNICQSYKAGYNTLELDKGWVTTNTMDVFSWADMSL